jgi:hypothetical protein
MADLSLPCSTLTFVIHAAAQIQKTRRLVDFFRWRAESAGDFSYPFPIFHSKLGRISPVFPSWITDLVLNYQFPVD